MKILNLLISFMLVFAIPSFAAKRAEVHQLTIGGAAVNGYFIQANNTVTSDSVNMNGNLGFLALATQVSGNVSISYQVSYDNINWFSPVLTNGSGAVTVESTLDTAIASGNTWITFPYTVYPYDRFIFQNNSATTDSVTAETVYQVAQ